MTRLGPLPGTGRIRRPLQYSSPVKNAHPRWLRQILFFVPKNVLVACEWPLLGYSRPVVVTAGRLTIPRRTGNELLTPVIICTRYTTNRLQARGWVRRKNLNQKSNEYEINSSSRIFWILLNDIYLSLIDEAMRWWWWLWWWSRRTALCSGFLQNAFILIIILPT